MISPVLQATAYLLLRIYGRDHRILDQIGDLDDVPEVVLDQEMLQGSIVFYAKNMPEQAEFAPGPLWRQHNEEEYLKGRKALDLRDALHIAAGRKYFEDIEAARAKFPEAVEPLLNTSTPQTTIGPNVAETEVSNADRHSAGDFVLRSKRPRFNERYDATVTLLSLILAKDHDRIRDSTEESVVNELRNDRDWIQGSIIFHVNRAPEEDRIDPNMLDLDEDKYLLGKVPLQFEDALRLAFKRQYLDLLEWARRQHPALMKDSFD